MSPNDRPEAAISRSTQPDIDASSSAIHFSKSARVTFFLIVTGPDSNANSDSTSTESSNFVRCTAS